MKSAKSQVKKKVQYDGEEYLMLKLIQLGLI